MSETATAKRQRTTGTDPNRTAGALRVAQDPGKAPVLIAQNDSWRKIARMVQDPSEGHDARHLAACWNAVEAIGGDPETVAELVAALRTQIEPRKKGWKVTDWAIRDEQARAVLARVGKVKA